MRRALALAFLIWAVLCAGPAFAQNPNQHPAQNPDQHSGQSSGALQARCLANAPGGEAIETILARGPLWRCGGSTAEIVARGVDPIADRLMLRFDGPEVAGAKIFRARIGAFRKLTLLVRGAQGQWAQRAYTMETVTPSTSGPKFSAALPDVPSPREIVAVIDGGRHNATAITAEIRSGDPAVLLGARQNLAILGVLLGMMLLPIVFDLAFYRVLRSRFLLWHIALSLSFVAMVLARTGVMNLFIAIPVPQWRFLLIASLAAIVAISLMFLRSFFEREVLGSFLYRAAPVMAVFMLAASLVYWIAPPAIRSLGGAFHSIVALPPFLCLVVMLVLAMLRGSRAARLLAAGWIALIVSAGISLATSLIPGVVPNDGLAMLYVGLLSEVVMTALAVADRFVLVKRERDAAWRETRFLHDLSMRDPLTGAMNRRALESQFDELVAEGFTTWALLDLDRFKSINDEYGHSAGDEVLKLAVKALGRDHEARVVRMGGEEFLILLRGAQAAERAERARQAITRLVCSEMEGLDHPVTASMGVLDFSAVADQVQIDFATIYSRADEMLYQAKCNGRNQGVAEQLAFFEPEDKEAATRAA